MTIGRTDDPENPFRAPAFEAAVLLGAGSRTPSGPADMAPRREGRTHDRNRPTRQISHFFSCIRGAVHTCNKVINRTRSGSGMPRLDGFGVHPRHQATILTFGRWRQR